MAVKRQLDEGGSGSSRIPTQPPKPRFKFRKVVKYVMKEAFLQDLVARLEPVLHRVVKQELEPILHRLQSSPGRPLVDQPKSSETAGLQLRFVNKLPSTVFTNSRIEAEGNAPIKIELLDAISESVIRHPPLSSIKIEILVLNGDFAANGQEGWGDKEFNENIVRERAGKRPLLVGELSLSLIHGVGFINNITFTDNSSWVRSRKFRLGVRVAPNASYGIGVKEAISDAFVVLDHRGESYQKHNTPALSDPVWRLKRIAKDGASHKRLAEGGIHTVRDFLQLYHVNPSLLKHILGNGVANKAWETIIDHANSCHLDSQIYVYYNTTRGVSLYFNCVYKVVGVSFGGDNYQSVDTLDKDQMVQIEELKQCAYNNLNELIPFNSSSDLCHMLPFPVRHTSSFSTPDEAESRLGRYHFQTSASHPCLMEDGIEVEEDSALNQGVSLAMSSLPRAGSSTQLFNGGYEWDPSFSMAAVVPDSSFFGKPTYPPTWHPSASHDDWAQAAGMFTVLGSNTHRGILSTPPYNGINISGIGKPKAGWCKIRAFVKLKIVRRYAARKKAKSVCRYC